MNMDDVSLVPRFDFHSDDAHEAHDRVNQSLPLARSVDVDSICVFFLCRLCLRLYRTMFANRLRELCAFLNPLSLSRSAL